MNTALSIIIFWHLIAVLPIGYAYVMHLNRKMKMAAAERQWRRLAEDMKNAYPDEDA